MMKMKKEKCWGVITKDKSAPEGKFKLYDDDTLSSGTVGRFMALKLKSVKHLTMDYDGGK